MTKKFEVDVSRLVEVIVDETKFTEEFMEEFRGYIDDSFYELHDHIEHLGWLYAAGRVNDNDFIEGYGPAKEFGIKFREIQDDIENVQEIKE